MSLFTFTYLIKVMTQKRYLKSIWETWINEKYILRTYLILF